MSSLAKRVMIVVFAGIGAVGVATLFGRKDDTARLEAAKARVDRECRAYRGQQRNQHAAVCRARDAYGPKAIPRRVEVSRQFDAARAKVAHGDSRGAETLLRSGLASVDDLEKTGGLLHELVAASIVREALEILSAHPELDARSVLRDVRLDATHPFEHVRLQYEWSLVHGSEGPAPQPNRSTSELVEAIEQSDVALREMDRTIVHADVAACEVASRSAHLDPEIAPDLCVKVVAIVQAAARLDAARR